MTFLLHQFKNPQNMYAFWIFRSIHQITCYKEHNQRLQLQKTWEFGSEIYIYIFFSHSKREGKKIHALAASFNLLPSSSFSPVIHMYVYIHFFKQSNYMMSLSNCIILGCFSCCIKPVLFEKSSGTISRGEKIAFRSLFLTIYIRKLSVLYMQRHIGG